jgi:hypothetical protein
LKKLTVIVNLFILFLVLTVVYKWANVVLLFIQMNKRTHISLIFILVLLASCQEGIDSGSLVFEKKMVLHCLFHPGENWQLKLESTRNILVAADTAAHIEGATINLKDQDGNLLGPFLYLGEGIYEIPDTYPEQGVLYRIEITHPDYPDINAESEVPEVFEVENIRGGGIQSAEPLTKIYSFTFESFSSSLSKVIIASHLTRLFLSNSGDSIFVEEMDLLAHYPESSNADQFLEEPKFSNLLFFNEIQHNNEILFQSLNGFRKEDEEFLVRGEANVKVERCSESYYRYRKSVEIYRSSQTKFVSSILPPVEIFSNVDGGLGIFAGSHQLGVEYVF